MHLHFHPQAQVVYVTRAALLQTPFRWKSSTNRVWIPPPRNRHPIGLSTNLVNVWPSKVQPPTSLLCLERKQIPRRCPKVAKGHCFRGIWPFHRLFLEPRDTSSSSLGGKSRTFRSYTFRFLQAAGQPEAPILPWHRVFSLVALPQPMALFLRFVMVFLNFYNGYWFITIYGKYMVNIW
jgi:hypothetical protein